MKNLMLTIAFCGLGWVATANAGGSRASRVEDLGKGLQKVTWYHDNGQVAEQGFYLDGKKHGIWANYSELGKLYSTVTWNKDKKDGDCAIMHENGKVKYQIIYSENKKVKVAEFDTTGLMLNRN